MLVLIQKKDIEDSIKGRLIISIGTIGIFFTLKTVNVKLPKAPLGAMNVMKLAGGVCGGVLIKNYAVYRKWIKE